MLLFVYYNILWFLAGFVTGVTSFGGNLLAIPLIALTMDPREAILYGCLSGGAIFLEVTILYFRHVIWREVLTIFAAAALGAPIGAWFLAHAGSAAILLAAGASLCLFLAWQFAAPKKSEQKPAGVLLCLPLGFVSGVMMAAVGMGGPPLVLCAFLRRWPKEETMGTINAVSVLIMLAALITQRQAGLFEPELVKMGGIGALFALGGALASLPVLRKINARFFRKLLLAMLSFSALILLARGFTAL